MLRVDLLGGRLKSPSRLFWYAFMDQLVGE